MESDAARERPVRRCRSLFFPILQRAWVPGVRRGLGHPTRVGRSDTAINSKRPCVESCRSLRAPLMALPILTAYGRLHLIGNMPLLFSVASQNKSLLISPYTA